MKTNQLGGFQLLDMHDFSSQGTALMGELDPSWKSKSYVPTAQ